MKRIFARTKNVEQFMEAIDAVRDAEPGHRMSLIIGPPGTGKTEVVQKVCIDREYTYIRAKRHMTIKSLLKTIARELGLHPEGTTDTLYERVLDELKATSKMLFVDEVDYLIRQDKVLTLVDLHDESQCPIVLVGMQSAKTKLERLPHLLDRCSAIVEFETFDQEDIKSLAKQICEVKLDDSAVKFIHQHGRGKFRRTMVYFTRAERTASTNKLKLVNGQHLNETRKKR